MHDTAAAATPRADFTLEESIKPTGLAAAASRAAPEVQGVATSGSAEPPRAAEGAVPDPLGHPLELKGDDEASPVGKTAAAEARLEVRITLCAL